MIATTPRDVVDARSDRGLHGAAVFFAIAVIVHNGDHLRRGGDKLDLDVFWIGGLGGIAFEVGLVVLICQRHRLAPLAAAVLGSGLAIAYLKVHFLPDHAWISDSFVSDRGTDALSWIAALLEVTAAVSIAVVGAAVLRRRGGLASATASRNATRRLRHALRQPLAAVMIISQAITLTAFMAQRYA